MKSHSFNHNYIASISFLCTSDNKLKIITHISIPAGEIEEMINDVAVVVVVVVVAVIANSEIKIIA